MDRQTITHIEGGHPDLFANLKDAILNLLLKNPDQWALAYSLAQLVLQPSARIKGLGDAGYTIENKTTRHGRQVHDSLRIGTHPGAQVGRGEP